MGLSVQAAFAWVKRRRRVVALGLSVPFLMSPQMGETPGYDYQLPKRPSAGAVSKEARAALRAQALTGSNSAVIAYAQADIATFWPQYYGRIVLMQGNGPAATDWLTYYSSFTRAWAIASDYKLPNPPLALHQQAQVSYQASQSANTGGTMITYPATVDGHYIPIIALPLAACRACENAALAPTVQTCYPLHPDTPYFEGLYRLRNIYHEEAHALRMLRGAYRWQTDRDSHREEVIADLFGDARMVQSMGEAGWSVVRRGQITLPITPSKSRHYYALQGRDLLMRWLEQNQSRLAEMHPDMLLDKVTEIAEKTLLTTQTLATLQKVESERGLLRLDSGQRLALAEGSAVPESEDVRDAKGCYWHYPQALRTMDSEAIKRGTPRGAALSDILEHNPLRSPALKGADPFAIDKRRSEQVRAILDFNRTHRPAACPALTPSDILAADLWLPSKPTPAPAKAPAVAAPQGCLR